MPRYTRCPYYIDDSRKTISCEDVCRSYNTAESKWTWMDMYCDSWDWMRCPYAADRTEAYRKYEEGDTTALDEQKDRAIKNEIRSLTTKLGRANKRIERQQKKIDELRAVNQSYTRVNLALEKQKAELYQKWRVTESRVREQDDKIWAEISSLSEIYEQRMAYLIDTYCPDKKLRERDVEEWAGDRSFAIVRDNTDDNETAWKVVFEEEGKKENGVEKKQEQVQE